MINQNFYQNMLYIYDLYIKYNNDMVNGKVEIGKRIN